MNQIFRRWRILKFSANLPGFLWLIGFPSLWIIIIPNRLYSWNKSQQIDVSEMLYAPTWYNKKRENYAVRQSRISFEDYDTP